jgi:hypothetical protein
MPVQLNHTIVWCRDKKRSSALLARILGCSPAVPFYHFMMVHLANNVSLDFMEKSGPIAVQHYAFLIEESEFDATFSRVCPTSSSTISCHDQNTGSLKGLSR